MTARLTYAFGAIFLILCVSGCSSEYRPHDRIVEDALGRAVRLPDSISRVVTLAPNLTEMVFAAGAGEKLVGVGQPDDYPPHIDTLPRYSVYPVDFEAIVGLQPDLVLASDQVNATRDAETFAELGIPTVFLASSTLEDVLEGILRIGELLDTPREARGTVDSLRLQLEDLRRRTHELTRRPLTLFLIGDDILYSFGRESYMHDLIEAAGGRSATASINSDAPVLSEEYVLATRPEVIIGPWGEDYDADRLIELHPTWEMLPAAKANRIYGVEASLVERPGPRIIEGAWSMARKIHPQLVKPNSVDENGDRNAE